MAKFMKILFVVAVCSVSLALTACGASDGCDEGTAQCSGTQIQICGADSNWGAAADCDAGQECMTMDDDTDMCMLPMGDDDDSS